MSPTRLWVPALTLCSALLLSAQTAEETMRRQAHADRVRQRQEEFYRMRSWPHNSVPPGARAAAIAEMEKMEPKASGPVWTLIGPRPTNVLAENGPGGNGSP